MVADPASLGIKKGERIGRPGILGQRVVVEPRASRVRVEHDVLEDGPKSLRRAKDVGFCLRGEPDRFRIRAVFEVEDAAF
jgi:hypothetical protein